MFQCVRSLGFWLRRTRSSTSFRGPHIQTALLRQMPVVLESAHVAAMGGRRLELLVEFRGNSASRRQDRMRFRKCRSRAAFGRATYPPWCFLTTLRAQLWPFGVGKPRPSLVSAALSAERSCAVAIREAAGCWRLRLALLFRGRALTIRLDPAVRRTRYGVPRSPDWAARCLKCAAGLRQVCTPRILPIEIAGSKLGSVRNSVYEPGRIHPCVITNRSSNCIAELGFRCVPLNRRIQLRCPIEKRLLWTYDENRSIQHETPPKRWSDRQWYGSEWTARSRNG